MNPALAPLLVKLGISAAASLPEIVQKVNRRLEEFYKFSSPYTVPWPMLNVGFETLRTETVGARSFSLQKGRLKGWFYRIVERRNIWTTWYFVWSQFETEADAVAQWEGFIDLLTARAMANQELETCKTEKAIL